MGVFDFMDNLIYSASDTVYELFSGKAFKGNNKSNALKSKQQTQQVQAKRIALPQPNKIEQQITVPKRLKKQNIASKTEFKQQSAISKDPFIEKQDEGTWNTVLDPTPPDIAAERIKLPKSDHKVTHETISSARKRFLFLNISDQSILKYVTGQDAPWTRLFTNELSLKNQTAFFEGLPIVLKAKRKQLIKECYFNPAKPTSQYQIHAYLQKRYANITRKQVTRTLHTLETYQRLRTRQLPNKVTGRIEVYSPGTLSCDTFYPTQKYGWPKGTVILSCMDMWSRFVGCFILGDKEKLTVQRGFESFIHDYMKFARSPPRKLIMDKGSELLGLDVIMEKFSKERPCVFRSLTGQPCNMIENVNANVQRKMQIYLEANVISSYEDCLWLVCNSLNNEKRKDRMGYTPIELLGLNKTMRSEVNSNYRFRTTFGAEKQPLEIGEYVRVLQLNRKEQISEKTKGFPAHWSRAIYQIIKRVAVIQNPGRYKYFLINLENGERLGGSRFRHEILQLKVKSLDEIDYDVPKIKVQKVPQSKYVIQATGPKGDYDPSQDM